VRRLIQSRLGEDRGAIAVLVGLLMVVLMGFAAISIDVGRLYVERRQLQNGADAAALAVACSVGTPQQKATLATDLAAKNEAAGRAQATVVPQSNGRVTVDTRSLNAAGGSDLPLSFAPVLGINSATVQASATAGCNKPDGGTAVLPLTFSYCSFANQTGGISSTQERTIYLPKPGNGNGNGNGNGKFEYEYEENESDRTCTGATGAPLPGAFGWLKTDGKAGAAGCQTQTSLTRNGGFASSDPGKSPSRGCDAALVAQTQGQTVLLPLYDKQSGSGNNGKYHIIGYAAFLITGYYFSNKYSWLNPCGPPDQCIRGYFTKFVSVSDAFTGSPTAPDFGVSQPTLTR